jgi:hypothetical protein
MTTLTSMLIFAARRGEGDPVIFFIGLILVVLAAFYLTIRNAIARYFSQIHVYDERSDEAYKAEVLWRREKRRRARAEREQRRAARRAEREERRAEREERRAERRVAREAYYREHGIEPGPLAWYRVLPDWQQAVLLGVAFAGPAVGLIVFLMR